MERKSFAWFIQISRILVLISCLSLPAKSQELDEVSRSGYLISAAELAFIKEQADSGRRIYVEYVGNFLERIGHPTEWENGQTGGEFQYQDGKCISDYFPDGDRFINQQGGAQDAYGKMLAYYLTGDIEYAIVARQRLLDITTTYGFGGDVYGGQNECILHLAFAIPLWIQAADLLHDTPIWTNNDKKQFQDWLIEEVYPKVAWSSRVRRNNWGTAGSLAASMIADYVFDRAILLSEVEPEERLLSPWQAYREHNAMQLKRMNTEWQGDSDCQNWGIQPSGGIPDELRRGSSGCEGLWIAEDDGSLTYQITHIDFLVFHAEFLRRRRDTSIYDNVEPTGAGSLKRAIRFVIANPENPDKSFDWPIYKIGILFVAYRYYDDAAMFAQLSTDSMERGGVISYGQLTHFIR